MTTLYASSASATAAYYTQYLTQAVGEQPGVWSGVQADQLALAGEVGAEALQALLEGRDPAVGTPLGQPLIDRFRADGTVVRAVAGFDATFSAPKSVSVLWALTSDPAILEVHDQAVTAALAHLERYGATTRARVNGARQHPDTNGLTMATFRQSTSRADDPQLHTHAVISTKVQTADGRWWALDARYLKRHQRMLGGLYQSALRAGVSERFGVAWGPVVNGQAEVAGIPDELLKAMSKRTAQVDALLTGKVAQFRDREGRDPSRWERAALTREAAVDSRAHKSGVGVADLTTRWLQEAAQLGWTADRVRNAVRDAARHVTRDPHPTITDVLDRLSTNGSTWSRADVVRVISDLAPTQPMTPVRCAAVIERAADRLLDACVDLDPTDDRVRRRASDGRSIWIEPIATRYTSRAILAEEDEVLTWAMDRHADELTPSTTVDAERLDVMQAAAAAAAAGWDRLVLIEGPAGTGKTTMLAAAIDDLAAHGRPVFGVAPTAKAARVLETETRLPADTIAKLLHEHHRSDRHPLERYQLPDGTTLVVDEAGMIGTPTLHQLTRLADRHEWRIVLVGDPHQLQAVGRGGLFAELCATGRVHELVTVHRFTDQWEAAASLQLRHGDAAVFDTYERHGRIRPGSLDTHLDRLAHDWLADDRDGRTVAITAATNEHVDAVNHTIQTARIDGGDLRRGATSLIGGGERACVGDIVVTRRNDRTLATSTGEPVRNRDRWTVAATHRDGTLTVTPLEGHGTIRLPVEYVREHVRLGYAATEHGNQGITVDVAYHLVTGTTTSRGLYVGATRGRQSNQFLVVTDTDDPADAQDVLERVATLDRADLPATAQRRHLHAVQPPASNPEPDPVWVPEPDWLRGWRDALGAQRRETLEDSKERDQRRHQAAHGLDALQPALETAEAAWQPFQERIDVIEHDLSHTLRPRMYQAHHDVHAAGFGHRHRAQRAARDADTAVRESEGEVRAIRDEGHEVKARLDDLMIRADELRRLAAPKPAWSFENQLLARTERLIDAIDTWNQWNTGHTTTVAALIDSLDTLTNEAERAPAFAPRRGEITRSQIQALTEPIAELLLERGLIRPSTIEHRVERDIGLGIDL